MRFRRVGTPAEVDIDAMNPIVVDSEEVLVTRLRKGTSLIAGMAKLDTDPERL
jgi:hypothetical protein